MIEADRAAAYLPALLALEARIDAVPAWPFDASSLLRFGFYLALGRSVEDPFDFLSAVGEAANREDAGNRALANLAKIFEVAVQDDSMDFSQARVEQVEGADVERGRHSRCRSAVGEPLREVERCLAVE